ncbi:hypothetical protein OTU49_009008 [Cherax quadricarinatus]|uniref:Uncharacterized protein n=1 Tax=Cherax quadricarinatus TaxID=27406 RepID=A0AAW0WMR7_CHEQU|nr:uncharacterized protein LOC128700320 isoform X2 [Cherax quadricarinatus]
MRNSGSVFQNMDGYSSKLAGELHNYNYSSSAQHFGPVSGGVSGPVQSMTSTSQFITQQSHSSSQLDSNIGLATGQGTNLQEEFCEGTGVGGGGGRKKKKKQKSGEDPSTSVKPNIMPEEDLVDAAIPLLSENQGVEDLLFPASLPPPGGTLVGGQYLLNNSLLDQILTEKKMQILQSPDVIEFLKKHMSKK